MIEYKCDKCGKIFSKQYNYNRHINNSKKCSPSKNIKPLKQFKCQACDVSFNRKDHLNQHLKTQTCLLNNKKIMKNNTVNIATNNNDNTNDIDINGDIVTGNQNAVNNNNNNITINYYNIVPFSKDGIENLSFFDKLSIFANICLNPYELIIMKTNLDPEKKDLHNFGFPDRKSGNCLIYNGEIWEYQRVSEAINQLLASKEKQLQKIADEIKIFLSDQQYLDFKDRCDLKKITLDPKTKTLFDSHLKNRFYNSRDLYLNAKEQTKDKNFLKNDSDIIDCKNKGVETFYGSLDANEIQHNFKDNVITFDGIKNLIKNKKSDRVSNLIEMCNIFLFLSIEKKIIDDDKIDLIKTFLDKETDFEYLNVMINILSQSLFFNRNITLPIILAKVRSISEIKNFNF